MLQKPALIMFVAFLAVSVIVAVFFAWPSMQKFMTRVFPLKHVPVVLAIYPGEGYKGAVDGFIDGLKTANFKSGADINVIIREANSENQVQAALKDFLPNEVDMIYSVTTATAQFVLSAVKNSGKNVPVLFTVVGDPIGAGLVKSFAEPGGNVTGCSNLSAQLMPKRFEIFKEVFSSKKKLRFAFFYNPKTSISKTAIKAIEDALPKLSGITVDLIPAQKEAELFDALAKLPQGKYDGITSAPDSSLLIYFDKMVARADELKVPIMSHEENFLDRGAVITYGASFYRSGVQCARLGDKILSGTLPQDLPVETPTELDLGINLKKAQEIGFAVRPEFIVKANRVLR